MRRFVFHSTGGTHTEEASEYEMGLTEGWRTDAVTSLVMCTLRLT